MTLRHPAYYLIALCLLAASRLPSAPWQQGGGGVLTPGGGVAPPDSAAANATNAAIAAPETPPPVVCPAGGPVGAIRLLVRPADARAEPLPLDKINNLSEGDTILYTPVLRGREVRHGEVALVMVPAKRDASDFLIVTDPKPADKPQAWTIDRTISIVGYIYGPEGLNKKKVKKFLAQDDLLIAQLADYAEKTEQTEALIAALSDQQASAASVNSALSGFASQYGIVAPIDKTQPPAVQAQTLFATMNPQLASYDPLTPSAGARLSQTASLTTTAASLFFGGPIGVAAGGAAMLIDLRAIAFPDTQFRSSFAEQMKTGVNLCGQRNAAPPHTRVAYIWPNRVPNMPAPDITVGTAHFIPAGEKTAVPVDAPERAWRYLDRARQWTLEDAAGHKTDIKVVKLANQKSLELDLTKSKLMPGEYRLAGYWDWKEFQPKGTVVLRALSNFKEAKLEASSQDRLLAKSGKIAVTLENDDYEFAAKVELKKAHDEFATPVAVPLVLPHGPRQGLQTHMDVQINTADLEAGDYELLVSQSDGKPHPVPIKILPAPPQIENLPILANQGTSTQHFVLKGQRLRLLAQLQAPGVQFELAPSGNDDSERGVTVEVGRDAKPGSEFPVSAFLQDHSEPLVLPNALRITGPLPLIASSKISLPAGLPIALNPGEFPAGNTLTVMLDVKNADRRSVLHLTCEGDAGPEATVRIGEQTEKWSLQQLSPDQLFLSFDTGALPAGCGLQASLDNHEEGRSEPYLLARLLRLPTIEQLTATSDQSGDGKREFLLTGKNLEMIQQAGWDQLSGSHVTELPTPLAGSGQRQTLRVALPDPPAPAAQLSLWLRGDKAGRSTTIALTASGPGAVVKTSHP